MEEIEIIEKEIGDVLEIEERIPMWKIYQDIYKAMAFSDRHAYDPKNGERTQYEIPANSK
jgi:hypothetical protein